MRSQRKAAFGDKLSHFLLHKLLPKLCIFTAATAALHIDYIGDGRLLNFAVFRTWIMLCCFLVYLVFTVCYAQVRWPSPAEIAISRPRRPSLLFSDRL